MNTPRTAAFLAASLGLIAGCTPRSPNLSPTPDQEPARHARALREADDVRRANRQAEADFYRRLGRGEVEPPEVGPSVPTTPPDDAPITLVGNGDDTP
ncbi:hypothetical protein [Tautonia plasticadhaerens]|uniref:Lipoprotein n=1 Tax=Tautonia plasticadhaerens TaxID=2527974 RepID=A0A518GXX6_9BACT|nr:hypothetical protein [Tautonia plasticadhaerens]QDV33413.1 hypothetical protein ElP_12840 [Tautonia plasticadhaerens]